MIDICLDPSGSDLDRDQFRKFEKKIFHGILPRNYAYPFSMTDFKTVKTFALIAKIGSGLSLSALFPAAKSSKVSS